MFKQLEDLKKLNFKVIALIKRRVTMLDQVTMARGDDQKARAQLMDLSLSPEQFTKLSNDARAAQRRRANLEDKLIDIETAIQETYTEMAVTLKAAAEGDFPTTLIDPTVTPVEQEEPVDPEAPIDGEYPQPQEDAA
jgi:hypothetical protein